MDEELQPRGDEQSGVRGGAVPAYMPSGAYAQPAERVMALTDRVHWSAVWGGFLTYFALWVWFAGLGAAIWLSGARPGTNPFGTGYAIWTGIAGLVAIFIGAAIAARLTRAIGPVNGAWHGAVLWGLSFSLLFLMASLGLGGALSAFLGGGGTSAMAGGQGGTAGATPGTGQMLYTAASSTWSFVIFQFLALLAAIGGGMAGARHELVEETETATHR